MTYVVGFTGTQNGMTDIQESRFCQEISIIQTKYKEEKLEFHHGDDEAADAKADTFIRIFIGNKIGRWEVHIHPPTNEYRRAFCERRGPTIVHKAKPFLSRNKDIVKTSNVLIATPSGPEKIRSGTWSTVRYTEKLGKPITIIMPNGQIGRKNHD